MLRRRLVLLKWRGDVIAAHTIEGGAAAPEVRAQVGDNADGVSVEVHDVNVDRASLGLAPKIDHLAVIGVLASIGAHGLLAGLILLGVFLSRSSERQEEAANERAAMLRDMTLRVAENDEAPKEEPREKVLPSPARELPPDEPIAAAPEPEPQPPSPNDSPPEPAPAPPPLEETSERAEEESREERRPVAKPGARGSDAETASSAVCARPVTKPSTGPTCRRSVVITSIHTRPFCFVDTVASEGERGTLMYPCDGDGEATLTFGSRSFVGASVDGTIDVCTGTQYPFKDGCTWSSAQHVTGSVASGTLRFAYGEAPKRALSGDTSHCAQACSATGVVEVERGLAL